MEHSEVSRTKALTILWKLDEDHLIVLDRKIGRIIVAHSFSASTTPFRVIADGEENFATCEWDAIAMHHTLESR